MTSFVQPQRIQLNGELSSRDFNIVLQKYKALSSSPKVSKKKLWDLNWEIKTIVFFFLQLPEKNLKVIKASWLQIQAQSFSYLRISFALPQGLKIIGNSLVRVQVS